MSKTMADQLSNLTGRPAPRNDRRNHGKGKTKPQGSMAPNLFRFAVNLINPNHLKGDGIDVININQLGSTELGPICYPAIHFPFHHPEFGPFDSISAFWAWVETGGVAHNLRKANNYQRKKIVDRLEKCDVPFIRYLVLDAIWQRLKTKKDLKKAFRDSTLPFDYFHVDSQSGYRRRQAISEWLIEGHELIREAVKKGTDPDFSAFDRGMSREEILEETMKTTGVRKFEKINLESNLGNNALYQSLTKKNAQRPSRPAPGKKPEAKAEGAIQEDLGRAQQVAGTIPEKELGELLDIKNDLKLRMAPIPSANPAFPDGLQKDLDESIASASEVVNTAATSAITNLIASTYDRALLLVKDHVEFADVNQGVAAVALAQLMLGGNTNVAAASAQLALSGRPPVECIAVLGEVADIDLGKTEMWDALMEMKEKLKAFVKANSSADLTDGAIPDEPVTTTTEAQPASEDPPAAVEKFALAP